MRYITASLIMVLMLAACSCVPSLHPLYTDRDVAFDPELLGEWIEAKPDSKSTLTFVKNSDTEYKLVSSDGKETSSFIAHLVKLGDTLFLDVSGDPSIDCHTLALPVHMFFLISRTKPVLRMSDFDDHWLDDFLKKNPAALKHEIVDKDLVLTASTKLLQTFLLRHAKTKGAFADPVDYVRKK